MFEIGCLRQDVQNEICREESERTEALGPSLTVDKFFI
jgi:hypothetical protein